MTTLVTGPQPLGMFPLPGGWLLIPSGRDTDPVRRALLTGRWPAAWPRRLRAHALAHAGDRDGALAALDADLAAGDDPVARYNRAVLDPDGTDVSGLRVALGPHGVLLDVLAFALGRSDSVPGATGHDGEVAALVRAASAAAALAHGDAARARDLLDAAAGDAAHVPVLAGTLLGAAAAAGRDAGEPAEVRRGRLHRAVRLLGPADALRVGRAELHLALADLEVADGHPAAAVPHFHAALGLVRREDAPELWAGAHADLATTYLTMPMTTASDRLRLGVATASLRAALTVFTREQYPRQWAAVQLDHANSLVYRPTRVDREHLVEAVELYEAVLAVRPARSDPAGRARVLANQGTVLGHLGRHGEATAALRSALGLFGLAGDDEGVAVAATALADLAAFRSTLGSAVAG